MKKPLPETITIRIPKAFHRRLKQLAAEKDLTVSQIIRHHFAKLFAEQDAEAGKGAA